MKFIHVIAFILMAVGGLNWGLVGLAGLLGMDPMSWNAVHLVLSSSTQVEWGVYLLVGVSTLWVLVTHKKECRACLAR